MTQKNRTSLVVLQTAIATVSLLMLVAGVFGIRVADNAGKKPLESRQSAFDGKLRPFIGKPYTEERHYQLLEIMRTSEEAKDSINETLTSACTLMRNLGGLLALGALGSLFLLSKKTAGGESRKDPS